MAANKNRRRFLSGVLFSALGAMCWGFSGTCSQFLFENYDINAVFMVMLRTFIAGLCFAGAILVGKRSEAKKLILQRPVGVLPDTAGPSSPGMSASSLSGMSRPSSSGVATSLRRRILRILLFGLTLFMSQIFYVLTISFTNAGTATVIMMLYLVIVMIYVAVSEHRLPTKWEMIGLVLAIFGTVAIATQGDLTTLNLPPEGLFFGVMSAVGCAGYIIVPKPLLARYDSFTVTGFGMIADAVMAFLIWCIFSVATGNVDIPSLDVAGMLALVVGMSLVGTFSAFWFFMRGVASAGTVTSSLIGALEPTTAMVFSTVWLGTAFTGYDWLGFFVMIIMLVFVTIRPNGGKGGSEGDGCGEGEGGGSVGAAGDREGDGGIEDADCGERCEGGKVASGRVAKR